MKTGIKTKALCLLLMLTVLPYALAAQAAPFEVSPLDPEAEGMVYTYWMAGPERTLLMPVKARADIIEDRKDVCILLITQEGFSDVQFAFFAFKNMDVASKDLSEYPDGDMQEVLASISSQPEALRFERYGEIAPGVTAVWADEEMSGSLYKHLVVLERGWIYNAMVQSLDGKAIPQAVMDVQRRLMESLFTDASTVQKAWTAGGVTLAVPDNFVINRPEEGDRDFSFAYICPDETGPLLSLCAVYAVGTSMPAGKSLQDLNAAQRTALIQAAPLRPEGKIIPLDVEGQPGIMRYTAKGEEIYAALHQGMLLLAMNLPRDESQQWEGDFRLAALNAMLGNKAAWPARVLEDSKIRKEGGALLIPSGGSVIRLAIPDGYSENIVRDDGEDKILGLESPDGPLYILRVMDAGIPMAPELAKGASAREATFNYLSEALLKITKDDAPDTVLTAEMLDPSLLGHPGGRILDKEGQYLMLFCALDYSLVLLSVQAEDDKLPEGMEDTLLGMMEI
jgi:hypothetical protein